MIDVDEIRYFQLSLAHGFSSWMNVACRAFGRKSEELIIVGMRDGGLASYSMKVILFLWLFKLLLLIGRLFKM